MGLTEGLRNTFRSLCGNQPFLLDACAFHYMDQPAGDSAPGPQALEAKITPELRSYFLQLEEILKGGAKLEKLCQVVVGPQLDVTPDDVAWLIGYGLLIEDCDGRLSPFSESLRQYVRHVSRHIQIEPLWDETEIALRCAIARRLEALYEEGWVEFLRRAKPVLVSRCESKMEAEHRNFGPNSSTDLLDYTIPDELWTRWPWIGNKLEPRFLEDQNRRGRRASKR